MVKLTKLPTYLFFIFLAITGSMISLFVEIMLLIQIPWIKMQQGKQAGGPLELLFLAIVLVMIPQYLIISIAKARILKSVEISKVEKVILSAIGTLLLYFLFNGMSYSWVGM